ncbi:MAG: hypothetical protein ACK5N8_08205 [Alphaproteobacteria bacterium]
MNALKLIFKSFYDTKASDDYIKNGKGSGNSILALCALVSLLAYSLSFFPVMYGVMGGEKLENEIRSAFSRLPRIEIEKGELLWEDNVKEKFVLDNNIYLTVDTQNDFPSVKDIGNSIIYITKHDIYLHSPQNGQIRSISFDDIHEATGESHIDLTSEEIQTFFIKFTKIFFWFAIVFLAMGSFFSLWVGNVILTGLTRSISSNISKSIQKREYFETRRMGAISTTPVILSIDLIQHFAGFPSSFMIKWIFILAIATFIMIKRESLVQNGATEDNNENSN